jgi:lipopolysaccharide transport protein LptA
MMMKHYDMISNFCHFSLGRRSFFGRKTSGTLFFLFLGMLLVAGSLIGGASLFADGGDADQGAEFKALEKEAPNEVKKGKSEKDEKKGAVGVDLFFDHRPRPENARTLIDAQQGAWFDDKKSIMEFYGDVVVHDPQFTLWCDRLQVTLDPKRQGISQAVAIGHVIVEEDTVDDEGEPISTLGQAGKATYFATTGKVVLSDWPEVSQGDNSQKAASDQTIMVIDKKGNFTTIGKSDTIMKPKQASEETHKEREGKKDPEKDPSSATPSVT